MFLRRQGIKLVRLLGFENFQIITHGFLVYPILGKYDFSFWPGFSASKKFSVYLGVAAYVISGHISRYNFRILPILYDYKIFLTS